MKAKTVVLGLLLMALSSTAMGFGKNGHRIVGQLAENHLSAATQQAVLRILHGESMAMVSNWADEMRSSPEPFWKDGTGCTWHFINTQKHQNYRESKKNPKGDSYEATLRFIATLEDPNATAEDQRDALRWLIHLVGDIHQPLHNGYEADRGGNLVSIKWFGEQTNLHELWDTRLIESQRLSYTEFVRALDDVDVKTVKEYQASTVMDWIDESINIRDEVYRIGDGDFGYVYIYRYLPTIKTRLVQAGIRLAGVLNAIYDPE